MKILVLYGTTEGQTRKIATYVAQHLRRGGDETELIDAGKGTDNLRLENYGAVLLAASVHAGEYQKAVVDFVKGRRAELERMPVALLSVSLSAASKDPDDLGGLAACVDRFRAATGWTGGEVHQVAGAFRMTEYDFFKKWMMRVIAWEKGIKLGDAQELELTDWEELARIADAFQMRAAHASSRPRAAS